MITAVRTIKIIKSTRATTGKMTISITIMPNGSKARREFVMTCPNIGFGFDWDFCAPSLESDSIILHSSSNRHFSNLNIFSGGGGGGAGMGKLAVTGVVSWLLGAKIHSGRVAKKLKTKHQKEQKQLYSQYYNDVYKLSEQNQKLASQAEELKELVASTEAKAELEALQRDYDEFKQPDIDGDDRISRAEFNMYVKNYLSSYPGLSEQDYPKFEDFDHDGDGFVSFQEYSQQMALQAQQAELEEMYSGTKSDKAQALKDLYASGLS